MKLLWLANVGALHPRPVEDDVKLCHHFSTSVWKLKSTNRQLTVSVSTPADFHDHLKLCRQITTVVSNWHKTKDLNTHQTEVRHYQWLHWRMVYLFPDDIELLLVQKKLFDKTEIEYVACRQHFRNCSNMQRQPIISASYVWDWYLPYFYYFFAMMAPTKLLDLF